MKNLRNKKLQTIMMTILLTLVLSACAQGEAHVTVHTDGTADVKLNLKIQDRNLELMGQKNLIQAIQNTFDENGFETQNTKSGDTSEVSASKEINLNEANGTKELPESISYSNVTQEGFLFTKYQITVDADLMSAIPDNTWTEHLQGIPSLVRNLLLKDVKLDLKLTLPIKPESSNADAVTADGKTMTWQVEPLSANHLELSVNVPNVQNIIITAVIALVLIVAIVWFIIRKVRRKK
ncbi:FeoB-associated Cys-rich membrane protein [Paenibacillus sp. Marseille-Q4541]|uniref:FeoB-associated Cys-rich membrane protein n=1 Tax=Paenibacillus sp. Marseille-Q4541 TaxID=2831522 RepID=UPI001BA98BA3|nr:FeoB-associated Cys-rich membrane protein [Paenibacillus sp. Marseille-Q4541]